MEGKESKRMAVRKNGEGRSWIIKVESNPDYCGVGAGGTQFANGKAVTTSERMADWFREHKGYVVEQVKEGGDPGDNKC